MKKFACILLTLVLVAALVVMPSSAATNKSDWQKQNGPATIKLTEEGIRCTLDEGLSFYKYIKDPVDAKNFTCTFIPHYEEYHGSFFAITLTGTKSYAGPGSNGLFLLFTLKSENVLNVEGQILHVGYYLTGEPPERNKDINIDTTKPITVKGLDNGDGTYTVSFEGSSDSYTFEIPENYQFTEDYNGECYFSFGGSCGTDEKRAITVVSVNGIDFSGNKPEPESEPSSDSSTDDDVLIGADIEEESVEKAPNGNAIIIIACCVVIVLSVGALVLVFLKKKSAKKQETQEKTD